MSTESSPGSLTREQARAQMTARALDNGTICAEHRALWRATASVEDAQLRARMEEHILTAYIMAKKMDARLRQYKAGRADA